MQIQICAVGKMKAGPEKALVEDYLTRFNRIGRNFGFGSIELKEIEDRKGGGAAAEAILLDRAVPKNSFVCILDERGQTYSSPQFAEQLSNWRDRGIDGVSFIIGGADGIDLDLRVRSDISISFGKMVWPHMLARVMLTEQLYRAATIIAGSPYHRS